MGEERDSLGDRMKRQYEDRCRYSLPRRTYTILRLDGKAFHTYTRGCEKPFDYALMERLSASALRLCSEAQGAQFAYLQSDECSVLLTDFTQATTEAWFDGNLQKIASVAASILTAEFHDKRATFDCRAFTIPDRVEVENYFIWRQKDWYRNSVQMMARSLYSQKQLHGKKCSEMLAMIQQAGKEWLDLSDTAKNGQLILRESESGFIRCAAFEFTNDRAALSSLIPNHGYALQPHA